MAQLVRSHRGQGAAEFHPERPYDPGIKRRILTTSLILGRAGVITGHVGYLVSCNSTGTTPSGALPVASCVIASANLQRLRLAAPSNGGLSFSPCGRRWPAGIATVSRHDIDCMSLKSMVGAGTSGKGEQGRLHSGLRRSIPRECFFIRSGEPAQIALRPLA